MKGEIGMIMGEREIQPSDRGPVIDPSMHYIRVDQIATHESEMAQNMERCMEQQGRLAQLVENLRSQLNQLQVNSVPNIAGRKYVTPDMGRIQGTNPLPKH